MYPLILVALEILPKLLFTEIKSLLEYTLYKVYSNNDLISVNNSLGNISNATNIKGYINAYNDNTHHVGITWKAYLDDNVIPSVIIDRDNFDVIPNNIRSDKNYKITDMKVVIVSGVWKLQINVYIDGRIYTQYIDLSDS